MSAAGEPTCPRCRSTTVPIVYGLPGPELSREAERGEVVLGGCIVFHNAPKRACRVCGLGFERVGAEEWAGEPADLRDGQGRDRDGRFTGS